MKQKAKRELLHVKVEGMNYHLDGGGQKIFFRGEWLEVMADQEGFLYIHPSGQKTIYLDNESQPEDLKKEPAGELFTPGEWRAEDGSHHIMSTERTGSIGQSFVMRLPNYENNFQPDLEGLSNAKLFAQAKNMYYALKNLLSELEDLPIPTSINSDLQKAKDIINKINSKS